MDRLALIVADPVKAMLIKVWSYIPAILGAIVILVIHMTQETPVKSPPNDHYRNNNQTNHRDG